MLGQWRTSEWWISGCVGEGRQSGKGGGLLMDEPLRLWDLPESSSLELSPHLQSSVLTLHFSFSHAEGISSTRGHSFPHPGRAHTSQGTLYSGPVAFKGGISSLGSVSVTVGGGGLALGLQPRPSTKETRDHILGARSSISHWRGSSGTLGSASLLSQTYPRDTSFSGYVGAQSRMVTTWEG